MQKGKSLWKEVIFFVPKGVFFFMKKIFHKKLNAYNFHILIKNDSLPLLLNEHLRNSLESLGLLELFKRKGIFST